MVRILGCKWVDDTTFAVESTGYVDRTWLGLAGFPHSETRRLEKRYQRVDRGTIHLTMKIDDPQAYTKPWIATPRVLKLRPRAEIRQGYCVASIPAPPVNSGRPEALRSSWCTLARW